MIHVVVMKCLIGLPLLIHIELLWRSWSRSFKNQGVRVGSFKSQGVRVGAFVYRLYSPGLHFTSSQSWVNLISGNVSQDSKGCNILMLGDNSSPAPKGSFKALRWSNQFPLWYFITFSVHYFFLLSCSLHKESRLLHLWLQMYLCMCTGLFIIFYFYYVYIYMGMYITIELLWNILFWQRHIGQ
jgi:hypothetical protein